ncbi:Hsp20/alpha crystallin family protein [Lipingzhangella sp. LS1_29]|uniref:Hsp20/alpha crystallin family protein n=1 Tax=Lipingzhangella rawalii TaxID=2055835 RepID=A0ABU2H5M8_9ACTN|nr:Hsp20/alpha crystallin family protein [Lipingzhangella rawalii]MDS1270588.1 Hsp20/alpha crystallin family protein [Lipingzhangella rawalii]
MALPMQRPARSSQYPRRRGSPRWDPFTDLDDLWNRMVSLIDDGGSEQGEAQARQWVPAVEAEEVEDAYLVRAELPGIRREDVDVEVQDQELLIKGEVSSEDDRPEAMRRRSGQFFYRATLPAAADASQISATLKDGVLSVRIPKGSTERSRSVEITEG